MSKDTNSFGHDKALACESRGFVYKKKRMHRFDTPSPGYLISPLTGRVFKIHEFFMHGFDDILML